jgi:catechol 2,3-dioxygenase-like lactoylglutathione lyase family enzyme
VVVAWAPNVRVRRMADTGGGCRGPQWERQAEPLRLSSPRERPSGSVRRDVLSIGSAIEREAVVVNSGAFKTSRQRGKLAPLKFEHAVLRTTRLQAMVEWYTTVLQAEVAFSNATIAFLCYDEQNHRIAIVARPGTIERPPNSAGLDHLAFTYADMAELVATYERLKATGMVPVRATNHGSSTSMYYGDPDGNQVELKIDNFDTVEEQHAWLRTKEFAENPIGTHFDPEVLVARFHAGVPDEQLKQPDAASSVEPVSL